MGQDAEERKPETSKYDILKAIYFYLLTPKMLLLGVIFVKIKSTAACKS